MKHLLLKSEKSIKFWILLTLLTVVACNSKILLIIRDSILITAENSGATVIPFIKIWLVIPTVMILVKLNGFLLNKLRLDQVFTLLSVFFVCFNLFFCYYLYPNIENLRLHQIAANFSSVFPSGLHTIFVLLDYWPYTLFFLFSEMWTTFIFAFMFWNLAAIVVEAKEAKNFYSYFSLDFAGILAASISFFGMAIAKKNYSQYLDIVAGIFFILAVGQIILFRFAYKNFRKIEVQPKKNKKKPNWRLLQEKSFCRYLFVLVFAFEFCDHFLEILWKDQIKAFYPDPMSFSRFMSQFVFLSALGVTLTVFFVSRHSIKSKPWSLNAYVTPVMVFTTSIILFISLTLKEFDSKWLWLAVGVSTIQAFFIKVVKPTFFDNSKELAFLSRDKDEIAGYRAVCDTLASRLGKSNSAIVLQILASTSIMGPFSWLPIAFLVLSGSFLWYHSVGRLKNMITN